MQFVWVAAAGAALSWLYLAAFDSLLCGRLAPRMSLLLAIVWFLEGTTILLLCIWVLAEGRFERLAAALAGFVIARALFDRHGHAEARSARRSRRELLGEQPLDRLA
jgi:hypothetical protein